MLVVIGLLIALCSLVANSVGGIVFGIVLVVIGVTTSNNNDPIKVKEKSDKKKIKEIVEVRDKLDYDRFATILRKNLTEDEFRHIDDTRQFVDSPNSATGIRVLLDRVETNKQTLLSAFGSSNCNDNSSVFICSASELFATARSNGDVSADNGTGSGCLVAPDGLAYCYK